MLSVILVDFNTIKASIDYIKVLEKKLTNCEKTHYIIVENGTEHLKDFCEYKLINRRKFKGYTADIIDIDGIEILYCENKKNGGYAQGNNVGIRMSKKIYDDEYLLISNNDILILEDIDFDKVKNVFVEKEDVAVVGVKVVDKNGNAQSPRKKVGYLNTFIIPYLAVALYRIVKIPIADMIYDAKTGYCYWVSGCFFFASTKKLFEVGLFDEETFLYSEEKILAERLKRKNYREYYLESLGIIHLDSGTVGKSISELKKIKQMQKSDLVYFEKYRKLNLVSKIFVKCYLGVFNGAFYLKQRMINRLKQ